MTSDMTTVKVRKSTRETIARAAREQGSTIDAFLVSLLAEHEWTTRMAAARTHMAHVDVHYLDETDLWDSGTAGDLR